MKIEEKNGQLVVTDFDELEVYKIASKIEQDGIKFYETLSNGVKDSQAKEKLSFLLQEEKKHLAFFQDLLSEAGKDSEDGFEDDNLLNYMDYGVFQPYQSMGEMKDIIDDVDKALDLGIVIEDRTIKFYAACKEKVTSEKTKNELQNIIEEEKRHKKLFEEMLK